MNNTLIFLRHAPTLKDLTVPIDKWDIRPDSIDTLNNLSILPDFKNIDVVYSSPKNKAISTARIFAQKNNLEIIPNADISEISKPNAEKLSTDEYEAMKINLLSDFDFTNLGWETANHAIDRFTRAINIIDTEHNNKKILVVSHGTILTIYFANLQNQLPQILDRWSKLKFGNYGVVKNGIVIRDII